MSRAIDTEQYRAALLAERKRVLGALEYLHREGPRAADVDAQEMPLDEDVAESASTTLEQEIDDTLEENSENVLAAIDEALARIDEGVFGVCVDCGREIAPERLEAIPYTSRCIDCRRREERG